MSRLTLWRHNVKLSPRWWRPSRQYFGFWSSRAATALHVSKKNITFCFRPQFPFKLAWTAFYDEVKITDKSVPVYKLFHGDCPTYIWLRRQLEWNADITKRMLKTHQFLYLTFLLIWRDCILLRKSFILFIVTLFSWIVSCKAIALVLTTFMQRD